MWPGFAFAAQDVPREEVNKEIRENPHGHVVLGDGPLHVGLYKQDDVWVRLNGQKLDLLEHGIDLPEEVVRTEDRNGEPCEPVLDILDRADRGGLEPLRFDFPDGSRLDVVWTRQDNYYVYARLEDLNALSGPAGRATGSARGSRMSSGATRRRSATGRSCGSGRTPSRNPRRENPPGFSRAAARFSS